MNKMIIKEIDLDIFEEIVMFAHSVECFDLLSKKLKDFELPPKSIAGMFSVEIDPKKDNFINLIWVRDGKDKRTILHETVHAVHRICSHRGIDCNEVTAYLTCYIYDKIITKSGAK